MSKQPKQMTLMLHTSPRTGFLDLPKHLIQKLMRHRLNHSGEIAILNEHQLQKIPGIGPAAVQQIEQALAKEGLHLDLPASHVIELFQLPKTHRGLAHDSPNKRLRGAPLEERNRAIYLAHKGGFDNLKIARKFRISKQTVAKAVKDERKREYRDVIAPHMVQEMARAGRAGEVPLSLFQGYEDKEPCHWAAEVLGGDPTLSEVVALFKRFTRAHLANYRYLIDEDIERLEELFGDLKLPTQTEFDDAAAARIGDRSEEANWDDVRYTDWDTRPASHFTSSRNNGYAKSTGYGRNCDPNLTLGMIKDYLLKIPKAGYPEISSRYREISEREYCALEDIAARHGGPDWMIAFVREDRAIWDLREAKAADLTTSQRTHPNPTIATEKSSFHERHPVASGLLSAGATAAAICAAALTFG